MEDHDNDSFGHNMASEILTHKDHILKLFWKKCSRKERKVNDDALVDI